MFSADTMLASVEISADSGVTLLRSSSTVVSLRSSGVTPSSLASPTLRIDLSSQEISFASTLSTTDGSTRSGAIGGFPDLLDFKLLLIDAESFDFRIENNDIRDLTLFLELLEPFVSIVAWSD